MAGADAAVYIPLLGGEKGEWRLRETFASSVAGAVIAILAAFAMLVEYAEPAAVSDAHVATYYLYYYQVRLVCLTQAVCAAGMPAYPGVQ